MRISDWSSDVCSSDLGGGQSQDGGEPRQQQHGGGNQNNNRRERFRNRRDRNRDRGGRDDGLPRDDHGNDQGPRLPPPSIPEGLPQHSLGHLKRMPAPQLLDIAQQLGLPDAAARPPQPGVTLPPPNGPPP